MVDMTFVECFNYECEREFETTEFKHADETVVCPYCKTEHKIDLDWGDDDDTFWYMHSIKQTQENV